MKLYKILIVDDEIDNIRIIRDCIVATAGPYTLFQALNGEMAIRIAVAEMPDLIITDWEMPGMNGIELIKRLKLNEITAEIPVMMCTGVMTTSEHLHTALMAGAVDYVRKPIDPIELTARLKSMLEFSDSKKELIDIKKRELVASALRLIHISELNNKLISDLEQISKYTNPEGKELIRATISQVGINSGKSVWNEFETRFEKVYESFYVSLNQLFPCLTSGDRKLCAFLR